MRVLILTLIAWALATPALAQSYRGEAIALDGRTIVISALGHGNTELRLLGIEAPPIDVANGDGWFARAALDDIIARGGGTVTCQGVGTEEGVTLAHCMLDGGNQRDVGLAMVTAGWAVPRRFVLREIENRIRIGFAQEYEKAEQAARRSRKGRWARMP
jgi:endonuclease YncB( thermonuclease family)